MFTLEIDKLKTEMAKVLNNKEVFAKIRCIDRIVQEFHARIIKSRKTWRDRCSVQCPACTETSRSIQQLEYRSLDQEARSRQTNLVLA